jgi:hypothetical protein
VAVPLWESGLWLWIGIVLVTFTLIPFRVDRYIYPVAPACCLLAVRGWLAASAEARWREFIATRAAVGFVAVAFAGAGLFAWSALPSLGVPLPTAAGIMPAVLVIGGVAMAATMMLRRGAGIPDLAGWPIATLLTVYASLVFVGLPIIRAGLPVEQIGRFVADQSGDDAPVGLLGLERWEVGLAYYLHQAPQHLRDSADAERFANMPGPRWIVMRRESAQTAPPGGCVTLTLPAIVGTKGRGIRTQVWGDVLVIRYNAGAPSASTSLAGGTCLVP